MNKPHNAIVTGASRGIGRAIAVGLASLGYHIAINYSGNETAALETQQLCQVHGVRAILCQANVADSTQVEAMFGKIASELGTLDVLVNNAGITQDNLLVRMSETEFDAVMDINLKGAFLCSKLAAKAMIKQRRGCIINISSVVGLIGNPGQANYCASKAGLIGLTKSMAKELAKRNITVNAIAPGFITTDMTDSLAPELKDQLQQSIPLGRLGSGEDIAQTVNFLTQSSYITGQVLSVDGGMAI